MTTSRKRNFLVSFVAIAAAAILAFALAGMSGTKAYAATNYNVDVTVKYGQTEARSMLKQVNSFRTGADAWYWNQADTQKVKQKLSGLTYDYNLEKVAMKRAAEIAFSYSHTRPNGQAWNTAYAELGYKYKACGENIAAGYTSASSVFTGWREDNCKYSGQGHRRNILSSNYKYIGIGHAYYNGTHYWVQEFSDTKGSTTATAASDVSKKVTVSASSSKISSISFSTSPTSLSVAKKGTVSTPSVTATMTVQEHWPLKSKVSVNVTPSYKSKNTSIATVSGTTVKGVNNGSTTLEGSSLGKTLSVPVKVTTPVSSLSISLSQTNYTYDGLAKKPTVTAKDGNTKLTLNKDYSVSYSANVNAGHASVVIKGMGNYTGSVTKYFDISKPSIGSGAISGINASYTYTGKALTPVPTVKLGTALLKANIDYTVAYVSNTNKGTATITITGKGNYTGTLNKTFKIA